MSIASPSFRGETLKRINIIGVENLDNDVNMTLKEDADEAPTVELIYSNDEPVQNRYKNKQDLETYAKNKLGKDKLDTYLVPDWQ